MFAHYVNKSARKARISAAILLLVTERKRKLMLPKSPESVHKNGADRSSIFSSYRVHSENVAFIELAMYPHVFISWIRH